MTSAFTAVLANSLVAFLTNTFVWFAVTFWVYIETESVIATSAMAGIYSITVAVSGFYLGSLVDRFPKKRVMLSSAIVSLLLVVAHLWTVAVPDAAPPRPDSAEAPATGIDLWGTIRVIGAVPGLFGLILLQCFNNFLGGVFMALMDAYGLLLVSVQVWGTLFGALSLGFIVGGLAIARFGLGSSPLRTMLLANLAMWTAAALFTVQASIVLAAVGMFVWLCLIPAVEAAEQTILQKVVPSERQGRVFGFAQSVEQAATLITALLMGPIAELLFIPFMTTGAGVELIGGWFGVGKDRGLALVFTLAGTAGMLVTLLAMRSSSYRRLAEQSRQARPQPAGATA